MSGIITLHLRVTILAMYEEYFYTLGRLRSHPLTTALAPDFETFRVKLDAGHLAELNLIGQKHDADAAVEWVDVDLDAILDLVAATTLIEAKLDRTAMPYALYFASQRPSELKRPILGGQLDTMRNWPPSLKGSSNALLQQYGTRLDDTVVIADERSKVQSSAHQALTDFRAVGTRKALVDELNARRKALYGQLGSIQHEHKELGSGWAESFFRQGSGSDKLTIKELDRRIAASEELLLNLQAQRKALLDADEQDRKAEAQQARNKKKAELEAAKKAAAELAARMAELEKELELEPELAGP